MFGYRATQFRDTGNRFVRALGNRLSMGVEPVCLLLQGDSTGNDNIEWFYQTMQWLALKFPAYTFLQRLWSDTHQNYSGAISTIQTGHTGDAYVTVNGTTGNLSTPDAVALRIVGDLDVIVKIFADDWACTSAGAILASKFGAAGDRGWAFGLENGTGKLYLWWSVDGTNLLGGEGSAFRSSIVPTVTNGAELWLRCTMDVDNGAAGHTVKFYTSNDGITWTQLGTDCVGVGITSIFASTEVLYVGRRASGGFLAGKIYKAIIKAGIDGKIIASPDAGMAHPIGTTSIKDAEGNTWTIVGTTGGGSPCAMILNSSKPGAAANYSTDVTRFGLQTPIEPQLSFISYSHNEGTKIAYQSEYEGLATQILTKYPNAGIVCVTQSPQKTPRTVAEVNAHAVRNRQIALVAAKNGYGLVDAFRAFIETGNPDSYIDSDGVHPTLVADNLWANEAIKFLFPAVR